MLTYEKIDEVTHQVADDLSDKVVVAHDVILCRLAIGNVRQNAQSLGTEQTEKLLK